MNRTLRQIELDVEVVIAERVVLRRVEHLEQRRRRVAAPVGAELVHLVQHDHRVHRARVTQGADETPGQRADVGAAMAADFGFVADAAKRHADELAARRLGDRLADRGLAGSRRTDQREDDAGPARVGHPALAPELAHRQVLGDALLHLVEPLVVGVEHFARVNGIEPLLGALRPGHRQQPVEVGADGRRLRVRVAQARQARRFAIGLLTDRLGHAGVRDLLPVVVRGRALVLAQLLADRVHLLAQEVVALLLLGAALDVLADPLANHQFGEPLLLELQRQREALHDVQRLEQLNLLGDVQVGRIAGGIGQGAGLGDRTHERADPAVVAADAENLLHHGAIVALELAGEAGRRRLIGPRLDLDPQHAVGVGGGHAGHGAMERGERHRGALSGEADAPGHLGHHADTGIGALLPGNQQHFGLTVHVDRQRDRSCRGTPPRRPGERS